jgi:hypothetical protein
MPIYQMHRSDIIWSTISWDKAKAPAGALMGFGPDKLPDDEIVSTASGAAGPLYVSASFSSKAFGVGSLPRKAIYASSGSRQTNKCSAWQDPALA